MRREQELEERQQERDWYDAEEFGGVTADGADGHNPFVGDDKFFQASSSAHTASCMCSAYGGRFVCLRGS